MVREPLLVPLLALAAGILAGRFNYFEIHELVWPLAVSAVLLAAAISLPAARRMRVLCLMMLLAFIGLATQVWHRQDFRPRLNVADGETALLEGCITDPPVFSDTKAIMTVHLSARSAARVTVLLKDQRRPHLWYGQRVEIAAKVRSPHNFQNPGEFDYAGWLANQHIFWTATASSVDDVRVEPGSCGHTGLAAVFGIRDWALARLDRLYPDDRQTGMLLKAVLLGQTAGVERRWTSDFRLTGTYHALVISGQHVAVLAVTLLFLLRLLHVGRIPSLALAALSCWMYALVTGMSAPVVRAAGGFTLFLMASYLFRRVRIVNALAVVGFAYLLFDPEELFDPQFSAFVSIGCRPSALCAPSDGALDGASSYRRRVAGSRGGKYQAGSEDRGAAGGTASVCGNDCGLVSLPAAGRDSHLRRFRPGGCVLGGRCPCFCLRPVRAGAPDDQLFSSCLLYGAFR